MYTIYTAIDWLLRFVEYAIFAVVIISWLPVPRDNQLVRLLHQITEPILAPIRALMERLLAGRNVMLDFSPLVALLLISFIRRLIIRLMFSSYF